MPQPATPSEQAATPREQELLARIATLEADQKQLQQDVVRLSREFPPDVAQAALEHATEGFMAINTAWQVVYLNRAASQRLGCANEEAAGQLLWQLFPKLADSSFGEMYRRVMEEGVPHTLEDYYPPRDAWFLTRAYPTPTGLALLFTDISEQKRAQEAQRQSWRTFRQIADSMPQLVWVTRPDGYHRYYNRRWHEYTGLGFTDTKGEGWNHVFHPDDQERAWQRWRHSLETGEPYEIEYRCRRHDGQYRWFLGRALAICDPTGQITDWFGTCTDIHDFKMAEEALRRSNADLQQFAYAASHDLQEPLRTITAYTQLLSRSHPRELSTDEQFYMGHILEGSRRLNELIKDLRAYLEVNSTEDPPRSPVDLALILEKVTDNLDTTIQESRVELTWDRLPVVSGSGIHFVQLLQNLLSNAIKYRKPNEVPRVHISAEKRESEWLIGVRDNGIGIDPAYQERIFGLFKRLHGKAVPGTGIGLAICQKLVERYGGRIWVESELGQGSVFYFSSPMV